MAGVFYYDGTDNDNLAITNDENLMYYVAGASTPNAPFGAVMTGVIRYPTQVKIRRVRNRNRTFNSVAYTEYPLTPVQGFGDLHGPASSSRTNTGSRIFQRFTTASTPAFRSRIFLYKYFVGWRFNRAMPAGTALMVEDYTNTIYAVPTARLAAGTNYYSWPSDKRDTGGGHDGQPFLFPDVLLVPNSSGVTFAVNATVMTYAWSDTA